MKKADAEAIAKILEANTVLIVSVDQAGNMNCSMSGNTTQILAAGSYALIKSQDAFRYAAKHEEEPLTKEGAISPEESNASKEIEEEEKVEASAEEPKPEEKAPEAVEEKPADDVQVPGASVPGVQNELGVEHE